jgi:acetyl-CoA carboxylase biotin carboxyl carrier protein
MDLTHIKALIETMAASDLAELEVSENGWTLRLSRTPSAPAAAPRPRPATLTEPAPSPDLHAPLSGIVHLQPTPGAPPFVTPGSPIAPGDTLCLIEAMKVFNTIRAERPGTIAAILIETGTDVEAGQPLMRLA